MVGSSFLGVKNGFKFSTPGSGKYIGLLADGKAAKPGRCGVRRQR
jgi:hypothetical protein